MEKEIESKYYVDNGREYVSWDTVQKELGISYIELLRLLQIMGWNWTLQHEFNGKAYFDREYAESVAKFLNDLKATNTLHRIKWTLPEC